MIKLSGHSLTPLIKFVPESMSLTLAERESTASIQIGPEGPEIAVGDWLMDDTEPGAGIVWRVKSISNTYSTETRSIQLEHIIQTLKDQILFGETTGSMMGGSDDSCPARSAVAYILSQQGVWRLGDFEYAISAGYEFNGDDLYGAIETVCETLEDCQWEYDLSQMPFTLHIRRQPTAVTCEMREGRNITTIRKTVDRSQMYTRIYPVGENNLHISGNYLSKNEGIYGIVSRTATDQSIGSEDMLRRWAQNRINRHCEPTVTIEITGLALIQATGEPMDRLKIGTRCQVPLPEYGTTIIERITKLNWRDKIRDPEGVTVTMANNLEDVATIIRREVTGSSSTAARGARAGAKKAEEDHAWFVDTTDHVGMVAEAVAGPGAAKDWSRVAEVMVDGQGIHQRVTQTEGSIITHESRIEVSERAIVQEVTDRSRQGQELSARITVTADRITQDVANKTAGLNSKIDQTATSIRTEVSDTAAGLQSSIDQQRDRISLVVEGTGSNAKIRPAQIVASINESGSNILLDADKIKIAGTTTIADVMTVQNGYVHINAPMMVSSGDSGHELMYVNGTLYVNRLAANSVEVPYHYSTRRTMNVVDAQVSGNTLTITYVDGTTATFRRVASLSGAWSGNTYTVSASPSGLVNPASTTLLSLSGTGSATVTGKLVSQLFNIMVNGTGSQPVASGAQLTAVIDASEVFENGKKDASVSIHSVEWESSSGALPTSRDLNILAWNVSNNAKKASRTVGFRLYKSGNTVYLQDNSSGSWVSRCMI